ncbi:hypothetical protein GGS23DRAFT_383877 [Durotheca rogersii]|uniref:uncharacterized protein n=1 Tax=Durotheca rogersii TaxID=419775 RepID=UPI00221E5885|nr:uncharacterized protein GGS23DRAFT_383877 [Durotheca rogersii]KAI5866360.1 hypothetical protein GGS23DRAFT_383877 [Durotheca rogersii]
MSILSALLNLSPKLIPTRHLYTTHTTPPTRETLLFPSSPSGVDLAPKGHSSPSTPFLFLFFHPLRHRLFSPSHSLGWVGIGLFSFLPVSHHIPHRRASQKGEKKKYHPRSRYFPAHHPSPFDISSDRPFDDRPPALPCLSLFNLVLVPSDLNARVRRAPFVRHHTQSRALPLT